MPDKLNHAKAANGSARTGRLLATSRNRAVLALIGAGLRSSQPEIRTVTIRAAIRRLEKPIHTELIRRFDTLSEADQAVLCEAHAAMPHHAAPALKAATLEGDATLCKNACRIIALAGDVDLIPVLVKAIEDKKHRHRSDVAATIHQLAIQVQHKVTQWAAGDRTGHDPSFARHHLLASLEHSLGRFAQHRSHEVITSFLLLAPVENSTLQRILGDSSHPCHTGLVAELHSTQESETIERLVEMLRDTDVSTAVLELIGNRADNRFVETLLRGLKRPLPVRVLQNMKRVRQLPWLNESRNLLLELDGRTQAVAIDLAVASDVNRDALFEFLAFVLGNGLAEARRASCQALAKFDNSRADELVLATLKDPDAGVQAAAVRQLRARRVPDALQRLVTLLDSRLPEVRDAARSSLAEFNFTRYRTMFDLLDEQSAKTTGILVHKVDNSAQHKLIEELSSPSIATKLRGIEMAVAMEAADDVRQQLIELAAYESVTVRKEAVAALAHCHGTDVIATLTRATSDLNHDIAETAQRSLAQVKRNESADTMFLAGGRT